MAKLVKKSNNKFTETIPKNSRFKTGDFRLFNPRKYIGNSIKIVYRSSYELTFMKKLELNSTVKSWNCENIIIPYKMMENGVLKSRDYYMDFEVISYSGKRYLCEVKPNTKVPKSSNAIKQNRDNYMNACKWKYTMLWCKRNNYTFVIITEKELKMFLNFN